jgi:hypothetical protein
MTSGSSLAGDEMTTLRDDDAGPLWKPSDDVDEIVTAVCCVYDDIGEPSDLDRDPSSELNLKPTADDDTVVLDVPAEAKASRSASSDEKLDAWRPKQVAGFLLGRLYGCHAHR